MVTQKQKFGSNRQINENKSRQKALIAAGHKELKVDGSQGPYQDKLWKDYKKNILKPLMLFQILHQQ